MKELFKRCKGFGIPPYMVEFIKVYKDYKFEVFIVFLTSAIPSFIYNYSILLVKDIFDNRNLSTLILYIILTAILMVTEGFVPYLVSTHNLSVKIVSNTRKRLFDKLMKLDTNFYVSRNSGNIITIMESCETLGSFHKVIFDNLSRLFTIVSIVYLIMTINILVGIYVALFIVCFSIGYIRYSKYIKSDKEFDNISRMKSERNIILDDCIRGNTILSSFDLKDYFKNKNTEIHNGLERSLIRHNQRWISFGAFIDVIMTLFGLVFILYTCFINPNTSSNDYVVFIYIEKLYNPLFWLIDTMMTFRNNYIVPAKNYFEIIDYDSEIKDGDIEIGAIDTIEFKNVSFGYSNDTTILRNINFIIHKGDRIGICGPTGSGKSTLINLISGFYNASDGEILVNGVNINNIKRSSLSKHLGLVNQDTFLFTDTVIENIRYGDMNATHNEIIEASKKANCHEFVMKLKGRYSTKLGANGIRISGGQKQKITLARTFLHDPDVFLLDEATSSLDRESEIAIQNTIDNEINNKTVIAIAHKLSTIKDFDMILVIKDGKIVERGTHDELLALNGVYTSLNK